MTIFFALILPTSSEHYTALKPIQEYKGQVLLLNQVTLPWKSYSLNLKYLLGHDFFLQQKEKGTDR